MGDQGVCGCAAGYFAGEVSGVVFSFRTVLLCNGQVPGGEDVLRKDGRGVSELWGREKSVIENNQRLGQ